MTCIWITHALDAHSCVPMWSQKILIRRTFIIKGASLVAQMVKHLSAMLETRVWSLGREDPLEKAVAPHSRTLAWKISWTEEPGRLQSMGSQRVGHDWVTSHSHSECHIIGIMWYVAFSYHLALCISGSSVSFCGLIAHFSLALNDILLYGVP